MEKLFELDRQLFLWINRDLANPIFDAFFPFWTDIQKTSVFHFFILPLLIALIYWRARLPGLLFLAASIVSLSIADFLASNWIKPWFERERPFLSLGREEVFLRVAEVGSSSFPSSHALDAFCIAVFVSYFFKNLAWIVLPLAFLTALSRVYNGVHFPLDVIAGAFFGIVIGSILAFLFWPWGLKLKQKIKEAE